MKTEFRCNRSPWMDRIEMVLFQKNETGELYAAAPVVLNKRVTFEIIEPTLRLEHDEAQFLMDQLWQCGLRPSEGSGSAGSLAATERHLADMQRIAFTLLDPSVDQVRELK